MSKAMLLSGEASARSERLIHQTAAAAAADSLHLQVLGASGAPGHPPDLTSGRRAVSGIKLCIC